MSLAVNAKGTRKKVIVLGGGVAGMSAAHELVERGYLVEVFERKGIAGGKARSLAAQTWPQGGSGPSASTASSAAPNAGRPPLPGEHGFRFFPRFYTHVVDTMGRIPCPGGTVAQNLVDTTEVLLASFDRPSFALPTRFPHTGEDLKTDLFAAVAILSGQFHVPFGEAALFAQKTWQMATSCEERRLVEYERVNWWDFIEADGRSDGYQKYFGIGFTRSLVAAKARRASTRTVGAMFLQMLFDVVQPGVSADRVLNGPTNDVWINPWLKYLRDRGVVYHMNAEVTAIHCDRAAVRAVTVVTDNVARRVEGDYFVAALPVEQVSTLLSPQLMALDASLANLNELTEYVEWMNGIQFYLTEDVPIAHGHAIYVDSPWALTSISQPQFWRGLNLADYGDGQVRGVLSVDISDWDVQGLGGKEARYCSREEIAAEVWQQLKRSLNTGGEELLRDDHLHSWFLDPDLIDADPSLPGLETNGEPLLVNYVDTWRLRPEAVTRIPNLFLASDYVRTYTDLATMEAANEAARRAVNGIIRASGADVKPCDLWNLQEPELFLPLRAYDRIRFRKGLPWDAGAADIANFALGLTSRATAVAAGMRPEGDAGGISGPVEALHDSVRQIVGGCGVGAASDPPRLSSVKGSGASGSEAQRSEAETAAAARSSSDAGLRRLRIVG